MIEEVVNCLCRQPYVAQKATEYAYKCELSSIYNMKHNIFDILGNVLFYF